MKNVFIHPGETILVQTGDNSFERLSYEAVLGLIKNNGSKPKKRNPGGKLSKRVGLVASLVRTGKWSTGAKTNIMEAVDAMITEFMNSPNSDTSNITQKAVDGLMFIHQSKNINPAQKEIIWDIISEVEFRRGECA